jgi:hypothetical protein
VESWIFFRSGGGRFWPETVAPVGHLRVRYQGRSCRADLLRWRQKLTQSGHSHHSDQNSLQVPMQKFACSSVRQRRGGSVVVQSVMPGEGVTLTWIAVNGRARLFCERRFDLSLRRLRDEFVLLAEVHQQGGVQPANLAEVFFRVAAMIGNGGVDLIAGGRDKGHQCTEAVPLQGNLSGRLWQLNSGADRFHDIFRARIAIIRRVKS